LKSLLFRRDSMSVHPYEREFPKHRKLLVRLEMLPIGAIDPIRFVT
jgi:hypothetical protein